MLYDEFNSYKNFAGADVFKNKATEKADVLKNLNPDFSVREYQKEALGRFYYYCEEYHQKQKPIHLMFNMATGSGKTLIMAANILYFYQKGYRNFIFFTRLGNIIQKTKANFLDPSSKKYLFADKIMFSGQEIKIKKVDNFEGVNEDDINIIFSTTALLHSRFNFAGENALTYEGIEDKKIVLIADEAHNLSAETNGKLSKAEAEDRQNWEKTVMRILNANDQKDNVLLEFTATARLEQEYPEILEKYKDKAIYRYDLKQYRLDGFSKEVSTKQVDAPLMDRVLVAILISQYRLKVAEKNKISLKPVVLFKANRVTSPRKQDNNTFDPQIVVSSQFKENFHKFITALEVKDILRMELLAESGESNVVKKALSFFKQNKITLANLVGEIKNDFAPDKCLTVDDDKDLEQKQILLNSLEDSNNQIRAIFATEKLNEGWDVLNLFDIVRLYNSRDAKNNRPGKTTVQEAQLIGRGARYYPFTIKNFADKYRRKFNDDISNELRILEQLYYHSVTNSRYIQELEGALVKEGIIPSHTVQRKLEIKEDFKKTGLWKKGYIFLNSRHVNTGDNVFGLKDIGVQFNKDMEANIYTLPTYESLESEIFNKKTGVGQNTKVQIKEFSLTDFDCNIIRSALSHNPSGRFNTLIKHLPNLKSIDEFITSKKYLGGVSVNVKATAESLQNLTQINKLNITKFVVDKILDSLGKEKREFYGTTEFKAFLINKVFENAKILQLDQDSPRAKEMHDFNFSDKSWFAQNEIWGTSEEEALMRFLEKSMEKLSNKYDNVALIRNEHHFKIYSFENGEPFYPDFVMFLTSKKSKKENIYQIFIEPKGDQFMDDKKTFEKSKEGWKQKLLLNIEKKHIVNLKIQNKQFKLIGLPFFNEGRINSALFEKFEEVFNKKIIENK